VLPKPRVSGMSGEQLRRGANLAEGVDAVPPYFDSFAEYKEFCVQYRSKLSQTVRATAGWLPEQARAVVGSRAVCPHLQLPALHRVPCSLCPSITVDGHSHTLPGHGARTQTLIGTGSQHVAGKCSIPCRGQSHRDQMRPLRTSTHTHVEVQALASATRRLQAALAADPATAQQSGRLDTAVYFLEAVISSVADAHLANGASRCPPGVCRKRHSLDRQV